MKYAFFKQNGDPETFHDDDTVEELPADALALTEDQWLVRWRLKASLGAISITANPIQPIESVKINALVSIDLACGQRRAAAVSGGLYIAEEYRRAYEDALAYKAAGYTGTVPSSVQSWKDASGMTNKAAADDIISARDGYMALLDAVRAIRLNGKAAVNAASTPDAIIAAVDAVNASLAGL